MDLIKVVNEAFATKKEFPAFKSCLLYTSDAADD